MLSLSLNITSLVLFPEAVKFLVYIKSPALKMTWFERTGCCQLEAVDANYCYADVDNVKEVLHVLQMNEYCATRLSNGVLKRDTDHLDKSYCDLRRRISIPRVVGCRLTSPGRFPQRCSNEVPVPRGQFSKQRLQVLRSDWQILKNGRTGADDDDANGQAEGQCM
ncbi:hypothetical protein AXG93_2956s1160 [Marchantia polymorpha subsp. ruderalis]|uniref:Uncharacterized protein n=1 Tax=Marchantia polymorpha subsp. ruderalis TaxID=1480154 RepID=A0A176WDC9_MARPO|nr:hypothetical protein AXG93_2956s1160 [Marchantia polymorpha subsp. ruderalis]